MKYFTDVTILLYCMTSRPGVIYITVSIKIEQKHLNLSCSRTQHSDAGEAPAHGPSVSGRALYH